MASVIPLNTRFVSPSSPSTSKESAMFADVLVHKPQRVCAHLCGQRIHTAAARRGQPQLVAKHPQLFILAQRAELRIKKLIREL